MVKINWQPESEKSAMKRVLIVGPSLNYLGGVARYYVNILPHLTVPYAYFGTGMAMGWVVNVFYFFSYVSRLASHTIVLLSPSLEWKCIVRDSLYAFAALLGGRSYAINFMGWDESFFQSLTQSRLMLKVVKRLLRGASFIVVPGSSFKIKFVEMLGERFANRIDVLYPPYEDGQDRYDFDTGRTFSRPYNVLLLSRLEKGKGVYDYLELSRKVSSDDFSFTLAGTGSEEAALQAAISREKYPVKLVGRVEGDEKYALYKRHHIFVYPSKHADGFPLTLAEVLRAGMVLVTSNAGCIADVIDDKNGAIVEDITAMAGAMEKLVLRNLDEVSAFNKQFASSSFSPHEIAKALENRIMETCLAK